MSSTRSRRTPTTAKVASSAPVSAPRSSRRRKAADNDANSDAAEGDDDDSSQVKQRSTKRQKRSPSSKKVTKSGGTRKKQEEEEEEEASDADMDSPASSRTNSKKSVTARRKSTRAKATKKDDIYDDDDDDDDEDEEMEVDANSPYGRHEHDVKLDAIVEPKYGLLFARQTTLQLLQRPALPKILTQHVCDFLSISRIASQVARISRSGYVTARSYAELVESQLVKSQKQDPEGKVFLVDSSTEDAQRKRFEQDRVGVRRSEGQVVSSSYSSNSRTFRLQRFTYRILQSRLRGLITEVSSPYEISNALPNLHTADLNICAMRTSMDYVFPPGLRRLRLTLDLNSKWNAKTMTQYLTRLFNGLKKLKFLNHLTIQPKGTWDEGCLHQYLGLFVEVLNALPHLRALHSTFHHLLTSNVDVMRSLPKTLTDITEIGRDDMNKWDTSSTRWSSNEGQIAIRVGKQKEFVTQVTKAPLPFLLLNTFAFDRIMKAEYIPIYSSISSTLTSLEFVRWDTTDVTWLGECTQLRTFSNCGITSDSYNPHYQPSQPLDANVLLPTPQLVGALVKCTHMTDLKLNLEKMTTFEFDQLLSSLTSLRQLQITSSEVYSIESFSKYEHLTRNLESLTISLPRVLRDDVVHLYSLKRLANLNIEGSFSEPLYSTHLVVLQGRTPRLPNLSRFTPRSQREPVSQMPLTPEVRSRHTAEFDARLRKGTVSSAEIMLADQLSLIFQFLNTTDFLRSARSCRTWNHAGSLPSAWPSCPTPFNSKADVDDCRRLRMSTQAPEFIPSVLPQLSLLRHVRYLRFFISVSDFGYNNWHPEPMMKPDQLKRYHDMIGTLPLLNRLESLHLEMTDQLEAGPVESALLALSPHLRHFSLILESLPVSSHHLDHPRPRFSFVGLLTQLRTFHILCPPHRLPKIDLTQMHQLESFRFGAFDDLKNLGLLEQLHTLCLQQKRLKSIVCEWKESAGKYVLRSPPYHVHLLIPSA